MEIIISVVLTVRNEERHIEECLNSILAFVTNDMFSVEIIVVDGMSDDKTRNIIDNMRNDSIRIIENFKLTQAHGFNIGVKATSGDWVAWLGAHSIYPNDYLLGLYQSAIRSNADYTGGVIETIPFDDSYSSSIVQALTTHKFGVGNSGFRVGAVEGPADTASFGIFKKEIFSKIGFFNENLLRAQDYEFNARIRHNGGSVWINPSMVVRYTNQPNLLKFLAKQFYKEAPYNVYMWYLAPYTFTYRHAITGLFAIGIISGALLSFLNSFVCYIYGSVLLIYFGLAIISAFQQVQKYGKLFHIIALPISFFLFHFIHGLGLIDGVLKLIFKTAPVQNNIANGTG